MRRHIQTSRRSCIRDFIFINISALLHTGGNPGTNLKSISHRCYLFEVAFVWELTKETIHLPLGCLQGGYPEDLTPSETQTTGASREWSRQAAPRCHRSEGGEVQRGLAQATQHSLTLSHSHSLSLTLSHTLDAGAESRRQSGEAPAWALCRPVLRGEGVLRGEAPAWALCRPVDHRGDIAVLVLHAPAPSCRKHDAGAGEDDVAPRHLANEEEQDESCGKAGRRRWAKAGGRRLAAGGRESLRWCALARRCPSLTPAARDGHAVGLVKRWDERAV